MTLAKKQKTVTVSIPATVHEFSRLKKNMFQSSGKRVRRNIGGNCGGGVGGGGIGNLHYGVLGGKKRKVP